MNGNIYSSGWSHLHETSENKVQFVPIENPDIISGTIECQGITYPIIYNEIEYNQLGGSNIDYRLVYIPKEGYVTNILLYINPNIFTRLDDNTIFFTKSIRNDSSDDIFQTKVKLQLTDEAIKQIENKLGIKI